MEAHSLTVGELPSHGHSASTSTTGNHSHSISAQHFTGSDNTISRYASDRDAATYWTSNAGDHSHSVTVNNTGNNQAHNNLQPYISVYIWKRIY